MNILLVSSYLPYPLFSGGNIRLYNIIRELSQKHQITLICEKRDYQTRADIEHVAQFCQKIITVPRKKQWSLSNIIKTGFSPYPFLMVGHTLPQMRKAIKDELKKGDFDLIHVETFYVMQNMPETALPLVLVEQNIEYMVYQRFADQANFFLKPLLHLDILKMKYWEDRFWTEASWVVVTSKEEQETVKRQNRHVDIVANGVDLKKYQLSSIKYKQSLLSHKLESQVSKKEKTILFIGNFRWIENRDAVEWLIKEIWPMIKLKVAPKLKVNLRLWIVGKDIPDSIKQLTDDQNVIFDERAPDDTRLIYERADLLLAPIRVGGGGKFKILESMASGVPVVTTSIGIGGIEASDGKEVFIADDVEGLVDRTTNILKNRDNIVERLLKNARRHIEEKYDWKKIAKTLELVYMKVCKGS